MYAGTAESALRQQLQAAGIDPDAISVVLRAGRWPEVPPWLAQQWAEGWDGQALLDLASLSPTDRQHALARRVEDFLHNPVNREHRIDQAINSSDADLRSAGELAADLRDVLVAFNREVFIPVIGRFTGKVRYHPVTELDVVTAKAVIEVTNQTDASGKVAQLAALLGPVANPSGLPVFHLMPNLGSASRAAQAMRAAGSAGVYNDRRTVAAIVRGLP